MTELHPPPPKRGLAFYAIPEDDRQRLEVAPRLASWMRYDHPDQARLAAFLAHAEGLVRPRLDGLQDPLALRLDVGLRPEVDLLHHHDLDNYLYPLVAKLGPRRFATIWGTKATSSESSISVGPARRRDVGRDGVQHAARTTRSTDSTDWKREIREQLAGAEELPDGPVEVELAFGVGPARNWTNLWKPAIDSLDSILGRERPDREWNPRDGRIVRLGLHCEETPSLGHEVEIGIRARTVSREEISGGPRG